MDIGAFGKGKGKQDKGKHGKGKGNGKQGQHGQNKDKSKDKSKDSDECWNVDTTRKTDGARRTPKEVRMENTNSRMQVLTILTRNLQLLNQKLKLMNSA